MDIRRLEAFCKVYELKSFSKAGQDLLLSQPTISAHVSALESELKTQLFDRLGRIVMPTQAGDILYKYSQQAFAILDNALAEIHLLQERVAGDLVIGGSTIPAHYLLPGIMAKFTAKYPDVRIQLQVDDSQGIIDRILHGDLSVGVIGMTMDHPDLVFSPLMEDELIVVASHKMARLYKRDDNDNIVIGTKELCTWPWVMREQGSGTRKAFENALIAIGLDIRCLNIAVEVQTNQAVLQCVAAGIGLSVTSRLAAADFLARNELICVNIPKLRMHREFYAVYHGKRHFFPAMRYFVEFLER